MPPLRERPDDIVPLLAERLLSRRRRSSPAPAPFPATMPPSLMALPLAGNIRELGNEIARALALARARMLPRHQLRRGCCTRLAEQAAENCRCRPIQAARSPAGWTREAMVLRETLLRHRWNKTRAAAELGLSRVGLSGKLAFGLRRRGATRAPATVLLTAGGGRLRRLQHVAAVRRRRLLMAQLQASGIESASRIPRSRGQRPPADAAMLALPGGPLPMTCCASKGALLRGLLPNSTSRFHLLAGTGSADDRLGARLLAAVARHVVAVGSCAAWGGITATVPTHRRLRPAVRR